MTSRLLTFGLMLAIAIAIGCEQPPAEVTTEPARPDAAKPNVDLAETKPSKPKPRVSGGPEIGVEAPEIEGVDLDGEEFKLSDYRGKVVMLDFYGDW